MVDTNTAVHAMIPNRPFEDERIKWIKERVEKGLEDEFRHVEEILKTLPASVTESNNFKANLFEQCLLKNDSTNLQTLYDYLEDAGNSKTAIIFWAEKLVYKLEPSENDIASKSAETSNSSDTKLETTQEATPIDSIPPESGSQNSQNSVGIQEITPEESDEKNNTASSNNDSGPDISLRESQTKLETGSQIDSVSVDQSKSGGHSFETYELHLATGVMPEGLVDHNAIYFMRIKPGPIPVPSQKGSSNINLESNDVMQEYLDLGYFSNQALLMLEQLLNEIYLPILCKIDLKDINDERGEAVSSRFDQLKSELLITMQKFSSQVTHTFQQVAGETRLKIPDEVTELNYLEVSDVVKDRSRLQKLETLAEEWADTIAGALLKEAQKVPSGNVV
jgi:dynein heavy chain